MERRIKILCKRAKKADKEAACELLKIFYGYLCTFEASLRQQRVRRLCRCLIPVDFRDDGS